MFLGGHHEIFASKCVYKIDANTHSVIEVAEYNKKGLCIRRKSYDELIPQIYEYDDNDNLISVSYAGTKEYYRYDSNNNLVEKLQLDFIKDKLCGTYHVYYVYDHNNLLISEKYEDKRIEYSYNSHGMIESKTIYSTTETDIDTYRYYYNYHDDGYECTVLLDYCEWYKEYTKYDKNNNIIYYFHKYDDDEDSIQEDAYEYSKHNLLICHKRTGEFVNTFCYDDKNRIISESFIYLDEDRKENKYYAEYNEDGYLLRDGTDDYPYIYSYEDLP